MQRCELLKKYESILAMQTRDFRNDIKRRRQQRFLIFVLGCLAVLSLLFLRIWMLSDAVKIAYEINELDVKKRVLQKDNDKILVEIDQLKSLDRINEIATKKLNMVRSSDTKVILIER